MNEAYAIKQTQFLRKPVSYVCQNANGPCPLLAIANVLLLRGQLTLEGVIEPPGFVSAQNLMRIVHNRLLDTNPPLKNASELQRLTQEKTLKDIEELLPSMLVGLDVNVRFHKITDFEYTVACAVFDMLDIMLVHGWLLDDQDQSTMKVVGNKSYNELIERLVDYRGVLLTEEANKQKTKEQVETDFTLETTSTQLGKKDGTSTVAANSKSTELLDQSTDLRREPASSTAVGSPTSTVSMSSPKKSPSEETVQLMMKERHISDADALDTATTLLEEGPVLEDFFNSTASQLTYYGLVKLHEGLRERQLCVFFRNNHFSTLFKYEGALYLLVTDAGYLEEPTVVWELLNEIDGDTEYFDAQFQSVTSSEQQQRILTQQQKQREQDKEEKEALQKAKDLSLTGHTSPCDMKQEVIINTRAVENKMPSCTSRNESVEQKDLNVDPDYLLALKFQHEEEEQARGVSPQQLQPVQTDCNDAKRENSNKKDLVEKNDSSQLRDGLTNDTRTKELIPVLADGLMMSEEELEAQRQAERYYQEKKRQIDAQTRQYKQEQDRLPQQRLQQLQTRTTRRRKTSDNSDCTLS